jgi:hypothetical protein
MCRRLAVPAIALALAFLGGGGTAYAQDRTDFFVSQLERAPVFVSDSIVRRVDDADRAALKREVKAMPFPTFLVVAPDLSEDYMSGEERLALLRDGLGEDGLYVITNDRGTSLDVSAFGVQPKLRAHDISMAVFWDMERNDPALKKIRYALALARGEPRLPRSQRATIPPHEGGPEITPYSTRAEERASSAGLGFALLGVFGLGAALSATTLERRRRRKRAVGARRASSLPAGNVRELALSTHARLAREVERKQAPNDRALDLQAAASMALDRQGGPIDDLGALILAERGRQALKGTERERCFFDPRHGGKITATRWRADRATIDVPACQGCARAIANDTAPDSLWDGDRPYWQRDTVWARTGFGALQRDMRRALAEDRR